MKWSANQEDERRAQLLLGQCIERNPLAVASTAKRTELVVSLPVTPADLEAWTYAEAQLDLDQHKNVVRQAIGRRGGVTTSQLLENATSAAAKHDAVR
jgi:hypothetical protein